MPQYLKEPRQRVDWLRVDRVLGEMGIGKDSQAGRKRFERMMEERRSMDDPESFRQIRRGWCFGDRSFREELKASMTEKMGPNHYGEERGETAEVRALGVFEKALQEQGLRKSDFGGLPKNHPKKVQIAMRLQAQTTMTASWIAQKLGMTSVGYLNRLLYLRRRAAAATKP